MISIPSFDLVEWLALEPGLALTKATNLFKVNYPDGLAGVFVSVHDTGGGNPTVAHDGAASDDPTMQVMIHNEDASKYEDTADKAFDIYKAMLELVNFMAPVSGTWYRSMRPSSIPRPFARQKPTDGWRFTFSVQAVRGIG